MASESLDVMALVSPHQMAQEIAQTFDRWRGDMARWRNEVNEIRDYVYATDTKSTTNNKLPFKNSTTTPKLSQLHMTLKANYMATMFGNRNWINWDAHNDDAALIDKRRAIESYVRTKAAQQDMVETLGTLLDDWILTGVCFGALDYMEEKHEIGDDVITGYVGPRLRRISPHDIVFNIAASSWERAPKIVRSVKSFGELARLAEAAPEMGFTADILNIMRNNRNTVRGAGSISAGEADKSRGLIADGFSSIEEYYNSEVIEVLDFYGDWYDMSTGKFLKNHVITVVDRAFIVRSEPINNWNGRPYLYYAPWKRRPDNLMGMSPLANLVGMQYKIDKLENLRADVFDQIANPTRVEIGDIEFHGVRGAPGGRYIGDRDANVFDLRPDATALNADLQIAQTMQLMEEMAGAPREALGLRSPGEKTAFEVQTLDNAAQRTFREKVQSFERNFVAPMLNDFLEMARRNLNGADIVRVEDNAFGAQAFMSVTRDDITAKGKLIASGSSHFEKQAVAVQNLNAIFNSQIGQLIAPHVSTIRLAQVVEDLLSSEQFEIVQENIGVIEQIKTQQIMQQGQIELEETAATSADIEEYEFE